MTEKKPKRIKYKLWHPAGHCEFNGGLSEGLFYAAHHWAGAAGPDRQAAGETCRARGGRTVSITSAHSTSGQRDGHGLNEIAASRAYGNLNNQSPRQKVRDLPDPLERFNADQSASESERSVPERAAPVGSQRPVNVLGRLSKTANTKNPAGNKQA